MKIIFSILTLCLSLTLQAKEKPNILFIISDDQALETIHALGTKDVRTPHIDTLVNSGVSFTNAYNMGAWTSAVCIPSRTMLMSGKFLWDVKDVATPEYKNPLLIEEIKKAGYNTYATGKWHVAAKKGFDELFDFTLDPRPGELALTKQDRSEFSPWNKSYGGYWVGNKHVTDITGESAVLLLHDAYREKEPFFLYVGFNAPHTTWQFDKELLKTYDPSTFEVPDNAIPEHFFVKNDWPKKVTKKFIAERYREVYIMVEQMDKQVGAILNKLKESGEYDNTIIVYMSDHGLSVGENGIVGKQNMYEKSLKAPLIISGPGIPKGKILNTKVYLQDIMPTILDYAGLNVPEYVEYKSLRKNIESNGKEAAPWNSIYGAYKQEIRSIYKGDHKLVLYANEDQKHLRLYNLENDPLEKTDLSQSKESKEIISALFNEMQSWEKKAGSDLDLTTHFSQPGL